MQSRKLNTGSDLLNDFLEGGYEHSVVSTIYGPAGSGKTTLGLMATIAAVRDGKKVFYVDSEGGFSIERFLQLCNMEKELLRNVLIMKPMNFEEQGKTIENIKKNINEQFGLVVVDSISMQYRAEVAKNKDIKNMNNKLGLQVAYLNEISRENNIPVIVTNQVYADFDPKGNNRDQVRMVGGDLLRYNSKCLMELSNVEKFNQETQETENSRKATIKMHRSLPENLTVEFKIVKEGLSRL